MKTEKLFQRSVAYLNKLCAEIPNRSVGSEGNRRATDFFRNEASVLGWDTEIDEFEAIDWEDGGARLRVNGLNFEVFVSPYSLGCNGEEELISASSIEELNEIDMGGKFLLLMGEIAKEQLMPKNFVFYNPDEHKRIISLLEKAGPKAIITATGRNAALAGGVYPFPMIEDGDFDIPSVYMTEEEGRRLLPFVGTRIQLVSVSRRIPAKGCNVTACKGKTAYPRFVVTAHIDAKKGSPGAIDNATGVVVLLLLADLLSDYNGEKRIELVALNGEDYYAVPGQMLFLDKNQDRFKEILLNINIDGAGYKAGKTAFSFYGLSKEMVEKVKDLLSNYPGIVEGEQWPQGDHGIFIQSGCPAIAVSSDWFIKNISDQEITHTAKDNLEIVDCRKLVEIAQTLNHLLRRQEEIWIS